MSVSQNKKNEQQNNLCTTLTEQWKKGELEAGWYYVLLFSNEEYIAFIDGNWVVDDRLIEADIKEVLAPVPSYEEWQELSKQRNQLIRDVKDLAYIQEENAQLHKFLEEFNALEVAKENQQLKELLKECHHYIVNTPVYPQGDDVKQAEIHRLLDKIERVLK